MIHPTLKFLAEQMNIYIDQVKKASDGVASPVAILENIARLDEETLKKTNNVFLSMVNLSEEFTMKNMPHYVVKKNEVVHYENPPLNLNLYILLTSCMTNYENALIYLSHALTFIQGKNTFSRQNSITKVDGLPENFRIILDLYSPTFEQANYLWSTLGGKQHPYACYKLRMIELKRESTSETRGVIRTVQVDEAGVS